MKTMPNVPITQEHLREHHAQCVERLRCKVCGEVPTANPFIYWPVDYGGKKKLPRNATCPCCERMVPPEVFDDMRYKWRASRFRAALRFAMSQQYTGGKS